MKGKKYKDIYLYAINLFLLPKVKANLVANQVELAWLTRYPLPNKLTVHRRKELLADLKL